MDRWTETGGSLTLELTTDAALAHDWARRLCDRLVGSGGLCRERRADVELAVHEALTNAAVHGNLGLPSSADHPAQLLRQVRRMLEHPDRAGRIVRVEAAWNDAALVVTICDSGAGFDSDEVADPAHEALSGRGLMIMRRLADDVLFSNGGRSVRLTFSMG